MRPPSIVGRYAKPWGTDGGWAWWIGGFHIALFPGCPKKVWRGLGILRRIETVYGWGWWVKYRRATIYQGWSNSRYNGLRCIRRRLEELAGDIDSVFYPERGCNDAQET